MQFKRSNRVGDQILREVSQMLQMNIKDPRIGLVTISHVLLTDDLRYARIYYTVFGDEAQRKDTLAGLQHATGYIRKQLGQRLRLRFVPEIAFHFDRSLDHVAHVEHILEEIKEKSPDDADLA